MYIKLKTERLILRPLQMEDLQAVYEYAGDKEDIKYMVYLPKESIDETRNFLKEVCEQWEKEQPDYYEFGVALGEKIIGAISIYMEDNGTKAELGWIINKNYRGMGYATEASRAAMDFAIKELGVTEIFAHCDIRNIPSANLMKKLGMTFEHEGDRHYDRTGEDAREYKYVLTIENKED